VKGQNEDFRKLFFILLPISKREGISGVRATRHARAGGGRGRGEAGGGREGKRKGKTLWRSTNRHCWWTVSGWGIARGPKKSPGAENSANRHKDQRSRFGVADSGRVGQKNRGTKNLGQKGPKGPGGSAPGDKFYGRPGPQILVTGAGKKFPGKVCVGAEGFAITTPLPTSGKSTRQSEGGTDYSEGPAHVYFGTSSGFPKKKGAGRRKKAHPGDRISPGNKTQFISNRRAARCGEGGGRGVGGAPGGGPSQPVGGTATRSCRVGSFHIYGRSGRALGSGSAVARGAFHFTPLKGRE